MKKNTTTKKLTNKDVAQKVVDRVVELIEEGKPLPWVKPWNRRPVTVEVVDGYKTVTVYPNAWRRTGEPYKGSNAWLPGGEYISWSQMKKEGASLTKGSRAFPVVYWNFIKKTEKDPNTGEDVEVTIPLLRYYNVFRVEDCYKVDKATGEVTPLKPKHDPGPRTITVPITRRVPVDADGVTLDPTAEAVVADYIDRAGNGFHVDRDEVSDRAFYSPGFDYVSVPTAAQFDRVTEFYSTLFHELGHSTGHKTRLDRFSNRSGSAAFGSENYSREELVAESTAAAILNALGMEDANTFRNSAAYIKSWSEHIKNDPMMFISATKHAQAAVDLILGSAPVSGAEADGDEESEESPV